MSPAEWEAVCDGCGKCCLISLEDEDTGDILLTDVHCKLFDSGACACSDYANRKRRVPDCVQLTPGKIAGLQWMPRTCAYRLLSEGKPLPAYHHLECGDRNAIHRAGMSVQDATETEEGKTEEDLIRRIVIWPGEPGREPGSEPE